MVSKVAVIALVAIIAVPIMLGYAMNLEQVTETDYKISGDSVNVTPLLQQGTGHTYTHGNIYELNTNFNIGHGVRTDPIYASHTNVKTSLNTGYDYYYQGYLPSLNLELSRWSYFSLYFNYDFATSAHPTMQILNNNTTVMYTFDHFISAFYDKSLQRFGVAYYSADGSSVNTQYIMVPDNQASTIFTKMSYSPSASGFTGTGFINYLYSDGSVNPGSTQYIDVSKGYYFQGTNQSWAINLPNYTNSILLTFDLNSITADNYSIRLSLGSSVILEKSTNDGIVSWKMIDQANPGRNRDLYYNQTGDNTYQILHTYNRSHDNGTRTFYDVTTECRYVGKWPAMIGVANYYQSYSLDTGFTTTSGVDINLNYMDLTNITGDNRTPLMRVDDAIFRGYSYPIIEDTTYNPADFKTNPSTVIMDPAIYGYSLSFGGNTYTVSNGSITLGSHQVPVKDLVLSSVPNPSGGYDNKIGNTVISTTADPSTITFGGQWSASISTTAQEEYEYTRTEWHAGSFAWDGVDQNFLMVGLITCLGVFVALGIYARRSGARVLPLMIVCGGAALLFFVML